MSLEAVPDEIIQQLLYLVSPEDNLNSFSLLSRRLHRLAGEPLLWRHHCQTTFRYWSPEHDFECKKNLKKISDVDWRGLFVLRRSSNAKASRHLEEAIATQVGRLQNYEEIARLGYDVKDFLIQQCQAPDSAEDALARRYHANVVLGSIHRDTAIRTWQTVQSKIEQQGGQYTNRLLEQAIAAFDLFVLYDQRGDVEEISTMLDDLCLKFRLETPEFRHLTTRNKALTLNRWLRSNNLAGISDPERNYRNLRNCFLGQVLRHPEHDCLPIISSVIFCSVAERLGMQSQCCAFPTHVHVVVYSDPGRGLDGDELQSPLDLQRMYLDPYGSDAEVLLSEGPLAAAIQSWGAGADSAFLVAVPPISLTMRNARNIKATASGTSRRDFPEYTRLLVGHDSVNMSASLYAALWASLILTPVNIFEWTEALEPFLRLFSKTWTEDAWLVQKYICPLAATERRPNPPGISRFPARLNRGGGRNNPWEILELVREHAAKPPLVFRRRQEESGDEHHLPFKVGQVFRHRRYNWIGVINGWADPITRALPQPHTISIDETMQDAADAGFVPAVTRPRNQVFFTCLRTSGMVRYVVAEQNIIITNDATAIPPEIFQLAGKFFKRFDEPSCTFISNIREMYPQD